MSVNFNRLAPFYDFLVRITFGTKLLAAKKIYLDYLADDKIKTILFIGGGTGELIAPILSLNHNCRIIYLEQSKKMIDIARNKLANDLHERVIFINESVLEYPVTSNCCHAIITNFLLDCFSDEDLRHLVDRYQLALRKGGIWLFTDFIRSESLINRLLIKGMYIFFKIGAALPVTNLPNYNYLLNNKAFLPLTSTCSINKMVLSTVLCKI